MQEHKIESHKHPLQTMEPYSLQKISIYPYAVNVCLNNVSRFTLNQTQIMAQCLLRFAVMLSKSTKYLTQIMTPRFGLLSFFRLIPSL